jgi:Holliday junction resolvasome RuvABC ATP-dependent DNA helicase subunit
MGFPITFSKMTPEEFKDLIANANKLKPKDLSISDLKWKYLIWSVLRRKNILFVGPTRCGKTTAIKAVARVLSVPFFVFDMGGSQDARATLIGNTTFKKETGTVFHPSPFVTAIQTRGAVILLDELTRGNHDAWNILMPVLDPTRRCLRLDEKEDSAVVNVEEVCFAATANIGSDYTATKTVDKALAARFPVKVEMCPLEKEELLNLIKVKFPNIKTSQGSTIYNLCEIADKTIRELRKDEPRLSSIIPTGSVLEMAQLVEDGFNLEEISEMTIYPDYPDDQGVDSERTFIKQLVEGYSPKKGAKNPLHDPAKP